jgi:hypothetical protein
VSAVATPDGCDGDPLAPLPDITDEPIEALAPGDDALGRALRQVLNSLDGRSEVLSAFGSFISD